MDHYLRTLCHQ